jgi:hypothetical protein
LSAESGWKEDTLQPGSSRSEERRNATQALITSNSLSAKHSERVPDEKLSVFGLSEKPDAKKEPERPKRRANPFRAVKRLLSRFLRNNF